MSAPVPPAGGYETSENSAGTTALITGILGIFVCPIVLSIIAIIFGRKGMTAAEAGRANNAGMAKAGFILGIIGLVLGVIGLLIWIFAFGFAVSQS
jgi:hypothetical protein